MDIKHINNFLVAKDCDRTNSIVPDTIAGDSVTGIQVTSSKQDDGTTATTYFGPGELAITDPSGLVVDNTVTKAVEGIKFLLRTSDGQSVLPYKELAGATVTDYNLQPYTAPAELVASVTGIPVYNDFSYIVRIRKVGTDKIKPGIPTSRTVNYISDATATATEIAQGLVDAINTGFSRETVLPVEAVLNATDDGVVIKAKSLEWELGAFAYEKLRFVVELVSFEATTVYNNTADLTVDTVTYPKATIGSGSYEQVADMEWFSRFFSGEFVQNDKAFLANEIRMNANSANTYDILTISWKDRDQSFGVHTARQGEITLALPVENNATNQVADIVATLDKYIVTEFGVGTALTGSLS